MNNASVANKEILNIEAIILSFIAISITIWNVSTFLSFQATISVTIVNLVKKPQYTQIVKLNVKHPSKCLLKI